ncbi:MAG: Omp28-related outer membrane protein [Bacteriodetes bacterium]|nr:Omp28-related outer membrane protein [Bacteroidota bacterium]
MIRFATRFLLVVIAVCCTGSVFAQTPLKRVLVEEFTGAWCPWCIDGPVKLAMLHEKYGSQVIAMAIHDNDSMTTQEYNETGGLKLMAPFFPAGCINRIYYAEEKTDKVGIDRENWEKRTGEELAKPAEADVKVTNVKFNAATRELTATVWAKFAQDVSGDLRFNLMIAEDGLVGNGTGWDQANAYNALKGQESHPWYGKGSPVKGFVHNHVFRKALGGAWGTASVIPQSVKNGDEFSKTYTYTIPGNWDAEKLTLIGVVQQYDTDVNNRRIINAYDVEMAAGPTKVLSTGGTVIVKSGTAYNYTFTVVNRTAEEQAYTITTNKSSRTPNDWLLVLNADTKFTLPAGASQTVTVTITVGQTVGIGDVEAYVVTDKDPATKYYARNLSVLHNGITAVELIAENSKYSIGMPKYVSVDINANFDIMNQLVLLPNLKSVVYNAGETGGISSTSAKKVADLLDRNVNVLLTGNNVLVSAKASYPELLSQILGVQLLGESTVGYEGSNKVAFTVQGVASDPITNGMELTNCMLEETKLQKLYVAGVNSKAILKAGTNESIAFRTQTSTARIVVLPNVSIFGAKKAELTEKVITWLEANTAKPQAIMHISSNLLMFGDVEVRARKTQTVTISNSGALPLVINKMEWQSSTDADNYSVTPAFPVTVESGGTVDVKITCHPKEVGNVGTSCTMYSNAVNSPSVAFLVRANATPSTSVEPSIVESNNVILGVSPNPANDAALIHLSLPTEQSVRILITDVIGHEIKTITNATMIAGEHTINIATNTLPQGTYRVHLVSGSTYLQVPLVIVR